ncbi:uncharacterized protein LOC120358359 [Solenopsis invicta]|uniref:uncharacterized protein LOC120358359 n=1 Tax=Solenopsis invicta TaxID=13686 RepID=UPI00193CCD4E|nr:uncharacterized protein LOC120358359 [Solenopsis invicta]
MNTAGSVFAKYRRHDDTAFFLVIIADGLLRFPMAGEAGEVETLPAQPDVSLENSLPPPIADIAKDDTGSLVRQLFGDRENEEFSPWEDIVIQTWQDLTRGGLATDQRELLVKKYGWLHTDREMPEPLRLTQGRRQRDQGRAQVAGHTKPDLSRGRGGIKRRRDLLSLK